MSEGIPSAYGLNFPGLDDDGYFLRAPEGAWPIVHASHERDHPGAPRMSPREQDLNRLERSSELGRVLLDRRTRTARYFTPWTLGTDEFVRPYLDNCVTAFSRWEGREVFHAGGFLTASGAWGLVGDSQAGKSTLLAALWQAGCGILTDDILVLDDERAFTGARCVDLRPEAVELLGLADQVRQVRRGTAQRLPMPPMESTVPFRGWVFLERGAERRVVRLPAADCLARVAGLRMWANVPTDPRRLLRYAALPAFEVRRPITQPGSSPMVDELLELTGATAPSRRAHAVTRLAS
jgi:hypothetical protein